MGAEQKAAEVGISFPTKEKGYLNLCVRSGDLLITSGWSAVKGFSAFRNEIALTQEEIQTITDWVNGGAPEGVHGRDAVGARNTL